MPDGLHSFVKKYCQYSRKQCYIKNIWKAFISKFSCNIDKFFAFYLDNSIMSINSKCKFKVNHDIHCNNIRNSHSSCKNIKKQVNYCSTEWMDKSSTAFANDKQATTPYLM